MLAQHRLGRELVGAEIFPDYILFSVMNIMVPYHLTLSRLFYSLRRP